MGIITEVTVPASEFALHETLTAVPEVRFDVMRVVEYGPGHVMPLVWVTGGDGDAVDDALRADSSVDELAQLSAFDGEWLYRMRWSSDSHAIDHVLVEENATILEATGRDDQWRLRVFFPDRDALSRAYHDCNERDLMLQIDTIYEMSTGHRDRYGLTERQHEALVSAFEYGYYEIPHGVSLGELGEHLGISHQSVSDRLRRGHGNLVEHTLMTTRRRDIGR